MPINKENNNFRKIADELTDKFINYQYRLENPFPSPTETPAAMLLKYRNDLIFHHKVQAMVAGVMSTVTKYIE